MEILLFSSYCPLLQHLYSPAAWTLHFLVPVSLRVPPPTHTHKKPSLLLLVSSHRPEQAPPTLRWISLTEVLTTHLKAQILMRVSMDQNVCLDFESKRGWNLIFSLQCWTFNSSQSKMAVADLYSAQLFSCSINNAQHLSDFNLRKPSLWQIRKQLYHMQLLYVVI